MVLEIDFHGPAGSRMLTLTSLPRGGAMAGLVVCSSVHAEFSRNYRREQFLAGRLPHRGVAVQRFQYRGTANSDGLAAVTFDSMLEDARAAARLIAERAGVSRVAFLGTRLGGLVAAAAAREAAGAPLALWEPVTDPQAFLREILRARLMGELKQGPATGTSTATLIDELRREGSVEVLGYAVGNTLHRSLEGRTLAGELGTAPRPLLLVQFSRRKGLRPELMSVSAEAEAVGWPVTSWVFPGEEAWWFTDDEVDRTVAGAKPLLDLTVDWLVARLAEQEVAS